MKTTLKRTPLLAILVATLAGQPSARARRTSSSTRPGREASARVVQMVLRHRAALPEHLARDVRSGRASGRPRGRSGAWGP
jgi:hypothetical protein